MRLLAALSCVAFVTGCGSGSDSGEAIGDPRSALGSEGLIREWTFDDEPAVDSRSGIVGNALRLDGFKVQRSDSNVRLSGRALSITSWVALKTYPITNAPFVNQQTFPSRGFYFGVEPSGRWYFAVAIEGSWHTVWAKDVLPKKRWLNVAATFSRGELQIFLDGENVGRTVVAGANEHTSFDGEKNEPLVIGRDNHSPKIGADFPTGLLNGLIDEMRLFERALSPDEIRAHYRAMANASVRAPDFRSGRKFETDLHRPRHHAMPPEAWTNEPHGLVKKGGEYHLFYQKNPNGPYWSKIHWGHMKSRDLVRWEEQPLALAPEAGWDREGVWSGNAVEDGSDLVLIYTGVDGEKAGVGLARSTNDGATWEKDASNPVVAAKPLGYDEMRDPFVWREGPLWYMIIGAGKGGRGTAILYKSADLKSWNLIGPFVENGAHDVGIFWEMPVLIPTGDGRHFLFLTTVEKSAPARSLYWIGRWENERFVPEFREPKNLDNFTHLLSPTFSRSHDGSLRAIGIVAESRSSKRQAEAGWAHTFGFPRAIRVCEDAPTEVCQTPAPELTSLRGQELSLIPRAFDGEIQEISQNVRGRQLELEVVIHPENSKSLRFSVLSSPDRSEETSIEIDFLRSRIRLDRSKSSGDPETSRDQKEVGIRLNPDRSLKVRVFVDHSIVEVFVDDRHAFSTRVYPTRVGSDLVRVESLGGSARLESFRSWPLVGEAMTEKAP